MSNTIMSKSEIWEYMSFLKEARKNCIKRRDARAFQVFLFNKELIRQRREAGKNVEMIAAEIGMVSSTLDKLCRKEGIYGKKGGQKRWQFTIQQEEEIKRLRLAGTMHKDIAKQFNVPTYVIASFCHLNKIYPIPEEIPEGMKKCRACKAIKLLDEFCKSSTIRGGYDIYCRDCKLEKHRAYCKKYPDKDRARKQKEHEINMERMKTDPEYAQKRRKYRNHYERERKKQDPQFKLHMRMKSSIHHSLKYGNGKNGRKWEKLVGYTCNDLMKHLQRQFQPGMSWNNYGEWHIDHIVPISAFNFQDAENIDFKRCWALKNLRPLWAQENFAKRNKIDTVFQPSLCI